MKLFRVLVVALAPWIVMAEGNSTKVQEEPTVQNVVFDCSSGDKKYVASRLWLIDVTIQELVSKKIPYNVVLTIHSGCTDIVSSKLKEGDTMMKKIHKNLEIVSKHAHVSIEACQIAVDRFKIKHDDLHPFISLVGNSITRVITLQNEGYAFIPFSK
jgi:intracellular sulfur oxidation DsrE/DsrF family protein